MTQFLNKSFSVYQSGNQAYRDNWDRIFNKADTCPCVVSHEPDCEVADAQSRFCPKCGKTDCGWFDERKYCGEKARIMAAVSRSGSR